MRAAPLWYWINERHRVYLARKRGNLAPWTDDPIFQGFRFCNVFRELDAVTVWIRQQIREPFADSPHLWFLLCVARIFNWPLTLDALLYVKALPTELNDQYDAEKLYGVVNEFRLDGIKRYTGAYMLRGPSRGGAWERDGLNNKDWYYAKGVLGGIWAASARFGAPHTYASTQGFTLALAAQMGFGRFMAYEVACDLHHTRMLANAPDRNTWAHAGLGAVRGLNRLLGHASKRPMKRAEALRHMRELLTMANGDESSLGLHVPRPLELRDIEHSLCETDKYLRVKLGEGRPRQLFAGGGSGE